MPAEDQIHSQPMNLGEVNLTLRFMQKGQDAQGQQLKEISSKIDSIVQNFAPLPEFVALKTHVEKDFCTKEEYQALQKAAAANSSDIRLLNTFRDTLTGKMLMVGSASTFAGGLLAIVISHFWR